MGDNTLFLSDNVDAQSTYVHQRKKAIEYLYEDNDRFLAWAMRLHLEKSKSYVVFHQNPSQLLEILCTQYKYIEAAGGLVENERHEILWIYRKGKWDLPKGKMEAGETIELTAIREVEEECGIQVGRLVSHVLTTYHTYKESKQYILKANHWYHMLASSAQPLTPQTSEGIDHVCWKNKSEWPDLLQKSYRSIEDVIMRFETLKV